MITILCREDNESLVKWVIMEIMIIGQGLCGSHGSKAKDSMSHMGDRSRTQWVTWIRGSVGHTVKE